ncbi:MAG: prenyltransferase [Candidatus Micrarchaeia archaeon]
MITYALLATYGYLMGIKDQGKLNLLILITIIFSTVLSLGATNIIDDYFDYSNGIDKVGDANSRTRIHLIIHNIYRPKIVLMIGLLLLIIPISSVIYFVVFLHLYYVVFFAIMAAFIIIEYAGPPLKYRYYYAGELGVFLSVIIVITGSYYLANGSMSFLSIFISIPAALIISDIAFLGNIRDINTDKVKGIRTIAILVNMKRAVIIYQSLFILAYIIILFLTIYGFLNYTSIIVFVTLPIVIYHDINFIKKGVPPDAEKTAGLISMIFMILIVISFIL